MPKRGRRTRESVSRTINAALDDAGRWLDHWGWTQGVAFAFDEEGEPCCALDWNAVRFSIAGALAAVALERVAFEAMNAVRNTLDASGWKGSVASWEQTHALEDALALLEQAKRHRNPRGRKTW